MIVADGLVGAGAAAEHDSRAAGARVGGRARPPQAVPAVRLGAAAVGHSEGTVLIGYYDYLGTRPKNSHRPIIVTGR